MASTLDAAKEHLVRFGLEAFRPGQDEVVTSVLEGRDCLCIMPTGGGKSLCYQLPAVAREGLTLVVSPLIALMKDQVDALRERGLSATLINSTLTPAEQRERIRRMQDGEFDLVYIAPERLRQQAFIAAVQETPISLLAIDEAHCISEWGHDFRPDYARLGDFRERLGFPQTIALTATATPTVRDDVVCQLRLKDPATFVTGFARPNLRFEVEQPASNRDKELALLRLLRETDGPAIVYAATRKKCESLMELISDELQRSAGIYHGGLAPEQRQEMQDAFMAGAVDVIVATNAFGMGVDKPDLRLVAHYNMPGSLEAYYQEAGRAGRDGAPSRCVLLFSYADRIIQEFFIDNNYPDRPTVRTVYEFLRSQRRDPVELTQQEIREALGLSVGAECVGAALRILDRNAGAVRRLDSKEKTASFWINSDLPTLVEVLPRNAKTQRKVMRAIESIVGDHRNERVPIRLEYLESKLGIERDPLMNALRELAKLEVFDYVPPFRGRALHVVDRDRPFDALQIDFAELAKRKAAELAKLDRVVAYAYCSGCRQEFVLDYFGDPHHASCGVCDQCRKSATPSPDRVACEVGEALSEVVLKILSGVARAKERFGKNVVAQMLCGSKSSKLQKYGLRKLSTFGLLASYSQKDVMILIDELLRCGLISQNDVQRFRPVMSLTSRGRDVMMGQAPPPSPFWLPRDLAIRFEANAKASQGQDPADFIGPPPDLQVRERLLRWRNETAQSLGYPPYTVLHNATIDRLASHLPQSRDDLRRIKGVGPQCLETWGEAILAIIGGAHPRDLAQARPDQAPENAGSVEGARQDGFQPGAAATVRHATRAVEEPPDDGLANQRSDREESDGVESDGVESDGMESDGVESDGVESDRVESDGEAPGNADVAPEESEEAYWTWRLMVAGFSEEEASRIRGMTARRIASHLRRAASEGWSDDAAPPTAEGGA